MATATKRPTTCGQMFVIDPAKGSQNCKRLPMHGGEHRGHLTMAAERRAVAASVKATKVAPKVARKVTGRKATITTIKALVRKAREQAGQPRGRLSVTTKRQVVGFIMQAVENGEATASVALGAVASLA